MNRFITLPRFSFQSVGRSFLMVGLMTTAFTGFLLVQSDAHRLKKVLEVPNSDFFYSPNWFIAPAFNGALYGEPSSEVWTKGSQTGIELLVRRTEYKGVRFWAVVGQRQAGSV